MYKYLNLFFFIFFLLTSCNNNNIQNIKQNFYGTDISQENIGKDFLLNSTKDKKISLKNSKDKINILIFGYTSCPDVCPTHLFNYTNAIKILAKNKKIKLYFITLDPQRDTKEVLQNYLKYFNKSFIGLIPDDKELLQIKKNWDIVSYKTNKNDSNYLINHSSGAYILVNSKPKLYEPYNLTDKQIAHDINLLINNYLK